MMADDFLSLRDFTPEQVRQLLDLAVRHQGAAGRRIPTALRGKTLALIFEKPSLRTRVSFDVGIQQLGGFSLYLSPAEINLGKRESIHDVAKNLERMVQGIMIRTFAHEIVEEMAERGVGPDHQRPDRLQPSLPGDGRLPDGPRGEGADRGHQARLRRRRQQRRALADVRRGPARRARLGRDARRLRAEGRRAGLGDGAGQRRRAAAASSPTTRSRACAARTSSTPTCGRAWARRPRRRRARRSSCRTR